MNRTTLDILCCPKCKNDLSFQGQGTHNEITEGELVCKSCRKNYTIEDGIVHFLQEGELFRFSRRAEFFQSIYASIYTPATNFMFIPCGGVKKARREVLERLEIPASAKILETGIGTGDNLPFLIKHPDHSSFFGIDNQQRMLKSCKRNLKKWKFQADLFWSNAEELPFKDQSFDVVFHLGAINLFCNKKQAINEMIRVARPGTKIVIADETEKASKYFSLFVGKHEKIVPPVDLIPDTMQDIRLDIIWHGFGYLIEFRVPGHEC